MSTPEVVCVGEALIDFVSLKSGVDLKDAPGFLKAPGGAPANVAVMVSRLKRTARFLGKVGKDPFGEYLRDVLAAEGVDAEHILFTEDARTGLAFVTLTASGERDFVFYRNPGADMLLHKDEMEEGIFQGARIFHFGSVSLASDPSRAAVLRGLGLARRLGLIITFDPNIRMNLWASEDEAIGWCRRVSAEVDVLKLSSEEARILSGETDLEKAASWLQAQGPPMVVITMGQDGAYYLNPQGSGYAPAYPVEAVDTTGAGDAFMGALLARLLEMEKDPRDVTRAEGMETLMFCNAAGALTSTRKGAISSLPTLEEVTSLSLA